jgi:hypothetical protein
MAVSIFTDGLYSTDGLVQILRQLLKSLTLADCSYATQHGTKICVTVATVPDGAPHVITNYQTNGTRPESCEIAPFKRHALTILSSWIPRPRAAGRAEQITVMADVSVLTENFVP